KLFLCATNVQTAKVKIFYGKEIGVPHLLASTCLPLLMQAVEVDGGFYWDGSYAGQSRAVSAALRLRDTRYSHGPHHAGRAPRRADHVAFDHESHAGDQFQYRADPRNAHHRLSEQADRRRQNG